MHRKTRLNSYPGRGMKENPCADLFYNALKEHGVELVGELQMNHDWLIKNSDRLNGIHLHWHESFWQIYKPKKPGCTRTFLRKLILGYWRILNQTDSITLEYH